VEEEDPKTKSERGNPRLHKMDHGQKRSNQGNGQDELVNKPKKSGSRRERRHHDIHGGKNKLKRETKTASRELSSLEKSDESKLLHTDRNPARNVLKKPRPLEADRSIDTSCLQRIRSREVKELGDREDG